MINIEATGRLNDVALSLGARFVVARQASAEVGSLRAFVDGAIQVIPIDLGLDVAAGTLAIADLLPDELALYVDLVRDLGDGGLRASPSR